MTNDILENDILNNLSKQKWQSQTKDSIDQSCGVKLCYKEHSYIFQFSTHLSIIFCINLYAAYKLIPLGGKQS